ncbi:amino acid/amide ABC transporter substrate-binding protein, HAAT family [Poseidonocella pacifica]|uniref:Amino acid/amide ABC transporter substrate-binding protein, HAAT family n=1 Tax=Poseidonocella pacifica TaxID=871651 RepID=A0A1I0YJI3_9RHOB|nr:ABC transporter substrate-binding protein [Poseidonocella pacifica]SFB12488.1 amino acid/amide ABC transporter substrate-binding protein, HAAT family [Poseidonocella pacifica]
MRHGLVGLLLGAWALVLGSAASAVEVSYAVLRVDYPVLAPISRLERIPVDMGFAGAELANQDNQTTGRFLGHTYTLTTVSAAPDDAPAAIDALIEEGIQLIAVLARDEDFLALADRAGEEALIFNAGAGGSALRDDACRANVIHVTPSDAMRADAVAQFAMWKKWPRWFLVAGSNPADIELAEAYRRSARKFGAKIVEDRTFEDTGGSRRADTGHVLVQRQIPVFSQDAEDHDIVIAADASDVFAPYLPFHLWDPRPVLGAAGLRPVTMHPAHEAWGATQYQTRFEDLTGRRVREEDYDTWLALRVVSEAVTRTGVSDVPALRDYILSDDFELAAFKGVPVTVRPWNGQLRQPILLYDGRITASVSPQDGFLHQVSPLDTLGIDRPETACTAFAN